MKRQPHVNSMTRCSPSTQSASIQVPFGVLQRLPKQNEETIKMAVNMSRPGGNVGFVGAPHGSGQIPLGRMFSYNIGLRGGLAPARAYLPELLAEVLAGRLDPSPVLDVTVSLTEVASGYAAMDQRQAIKVMVRP